MPVKKPDEAKLLASLLNERQFVVEYGHEYVIWLHIAKYLYTSDSWRTSTCQYNVWNNGLGKIRVFVDDG